MGLKDGQLVPFVQETVLNSYERAGDYDVKAADDYWAKTASYWAEVRKAWDEVISRGNGVTVAEVAESGSVGAERLMTIADDVATGKVGQNNAVRRARDVIAEVRPINRPSNKDNPMKEPPDV
jgi:hypothetical protein